MFFWRWSYILAASGFCFHECYRVLEPKIRRRRIRNKLSQRTREEWGYYGTYDDLCLSVCLSF